MLGGLLKTRRWEDLPPNKPVCPGCKNHVWYVSQRVQRRGLHCPECNRYYFYIRQLDNAYELAYVGRFKSRAEIERRLKEYIDENELDGQSAD